MLISLLKGNTSASVASLSTLEDLKNSIISNDWAPGLFKDNYRNNDNFESTSLIVLDIDSGMSLGNALEIFKPYKYVIATTKSHQKEKNGKPACDRYRVVLFLSRDIKDKDTFYATWFSLQAKFPFIDPACKDPARFFYKCTDSAVYINEDGAAVEPVAPAPKEPAKPRAATDMGEAKGKLSRATQNFLFSGAEAGTWNDRLFRAAKDACEQGYDQEWFQNRAWVVMEEKRDNFDAATQHESMRTIESAFSKTPKYAPRGLELPDIRETVLRSHLFIANHDSQITRLMDMELGLVHDISHDNIKNRLGMGKGGEYHPYASTNLVYANFVYEPHLNKAVYADENGLACFNEYQPPHWKRQEFYFGKALEPNPDIPDLYFELFLHFCGGDGESLIYLIDWLANSIQSRNYTILCAIGNQGIGKGLLGDIMKGLHGQNNYVKVRDQVFKSQFNGQLANKTLVHVDEVNLNTKEAVDRIKDVVNSHIEIESKGENARSVRNHASFYLSSNSLDAVKIEPGDRRFSVLELTDVSLKETALIHKYADYVRPENISALGRYLKTKKVTSNMLTPFVSARWEQVREASLTEWESWVIFDWATQNKGMSMGIEDLQEKIQSKTGVKAPGRLKIENLCKKYPEVLSFNKANGTRTVTVKGEKR